MEIKINFVVFHKFWSKFLLLAFLFVTELKYGCNFNELAETCVPLGTLANINMRNRLYLSE